MAGKRIDIMNLRDLIQLKTKDLSNRKIASLLGISRNTVNDYTRLIDSHKISYEELLDLKDKDLRDLFPDESEVDGYRYQELSRYFTYFEQELKKPGCTRMVLWKEYIEKHPDGYLRSQFNFHLQQWRAQVKSSCKLEHKVGEKLFIDFTGKKLSYVEKDTGEVIDVNVFVGILPASGYTYVTATRTQSSQDVIPALSKCLTYIDGVPLAIVPDNMKSAVIKSHRHNPKINPTLRDFARHYGCVIDPTRPSSPQDKAMVEGAVKLVYQRIFYPMSKYTFFSIEELNKEIEVLLDKYNKYTFSQSTSNREQEFLALEKEYLQSLPNEPYQIRYFKKLKVQKMGYIHLGKDKHYYSVPFRFIGKEVTVGYDLSNVEVFFKKERVAFHKRDYRQGKYTTNSDHLSSSNKAYSQWSLAYFQAKAKGMGAYTYRYITDLILQRAYPEIGYKQAHGIILLQKEYPLNRIDKACERAFGHGDHNYHMIENILKKGLDKEQVEQIQTPHISPHENLRGPDSFS